MKIIKRTSQEESARLGYEEIYISKYNMKGLKPEEYDIKIIPLSRVTDLITKLL